MPFIGAGGFYLIPRRELGPAQGPMPEYVFRPSIRTPQPLSPAAQTYTRPEVLGPSELVGNVGAPNGAPIGTVTATVTGESRGVQIRGAGGVILNLAVGVATRAVGLPGIVASVINVIIGAARRSGTDQSSTGTQGPGTTYAADTPPGAFFGGFAGGAVASIASPAAPSDQMTFADTGDELVMPGTTADPVPETQSLPAPGFDTEISGGYGSGETPAVDLPGPDLSFNGNGGFAI